MEEIFHPIEQCLEMNSLKLLKNLRTLPRELGNHVRIQVVTNCRRKTFQRPNRVAHRF